MEIGMGQHGEAGTGRMKVKTADETAEAMLNQLLVDLKIQAGERILVLLNGAGASTLMELLIVFRRIHQICAAKQIRIVASKVGEYLTVQEMAGFQLNIMRMDGQLLQLWNAPCDTPYLTMR
jgi:dihydroxyacetone kinase-like protein